MAPIMQPYRIHACFSFISPGQGQAVGILSVAIITDSIKNADSTGSRGSVRLSGQADGAFPSVLDVESTVVCFRLCLAYWLDTSVTVTMT